MKTTKKQRETMKKYYSKPENKIKKKIYMAKYLIEYGKKNKDKIKEKKRIYYIKNKEKINQRNKRWHNENKDRFKNYLEKYYSNPKNIERRNNNSKKWYDSLNKNKYREKKRDWENKKRNEDIQFKIKKNLRSRISNAFKMYIKSNKIRDFRTNIIDYKKIIKRLIETLPKDFESKNYEIDHIKPLCSFDLTNQEEIKIAFSPDNHQWLTKEDNSKKIKEDLKQRKKF